VIGGFDHFEEIFILYNTNFKVKIVFAGYLEIVAVYHLLIDLLKFIPYKLLLI
jgi:hypothetical protein